MSGLLASRRTRRRVGDALAYAIAIGATVVTLFPLYWLFVISTKTPREAFKSPPDLIYVPDFSKYVAVWTTAGFGRAFLTSVIVVVLGVALAVVVATPAAYALVRFKVRGGRLIKVGSCSRTPSRSSCS